MGWFQIGGDWFNTDKFISFVVRDVQSGNGGCCGGSYSYVIKGCMENMQELQIGNPFPYEEEAQAFLDRAMDNEF